MNLGILKEIRPSERRIALTPSGVHALSALGNILYIQRGAGEGAWFSDEEYLTAGAKISYSAEEVIKRSEVILKISPPDDTDVTMLGEGQTIISSLHLAVSKGNIVKSLLHQKVTAIAYELIEDQQGNLPGVQVMSEIGGQLSVQVAAQHLMGGEGGRGILLGSVPGIAPANVVIIGAGTVGRTAARVAVGFGASVLILDHDLARLREVENLFHWRIGTSLATESNVAAAVASADVVIGAVLLKGEKAPHIITEAMVQTMRPGSVIVDVSIDQGGCVETSRPTTIEEPVFIRHGVVHYCVPNMPAVVARTASLGWTNALLPYLLTITGSGVIGSLKIDRGLAKGVCTYNGHCTNSAVGHTFNMSSKNLSLILP